MVAWVLYAGITVATVAYVYYKYIHRSVKPGEPPMVPGSHWLFGSGKDFHDNAVNFLNDTRKKVGDVFTVRFLNEYWTFIVDIHSYEKFAREKNFDFNPIAKQVNSNLFDFGFASDGKMKGHASQKMNGKFLPIQLESFSKHLSEELEIDGKEEETITSDTTVINNAINNSETQNVGNIHSNPADMKIERLINIDPKNVNEVDGWVQKPMLRYFSDTFFASIFYTLFGKEQSHHSYTDIFRPITFHENFEIYNKYFTYVSFGLPRKLFPEAMSSHQVLCKQPTGSEILERDGASDYMKFAIDFMIQHKQPDEIIQGHNLLILHISYNSLRAVFWCVYKLTQDEKALSALRKEIDEIVEAKRSGDKNEKAVDITLEDVNSLQVLDSFVQEIFRWTGGSFMVRQCLEDTDFTTAEGKTFKIRKGDKVTLFPPAYHMHEEVFDNPSEFRYDRFLNRDHYKNGRKVQTPIVVHGSLCPGQKISILQIKWFTLTWVNAFKTEMCEGESTTPNLKAYGHEILPPMNDVNIRFQKKEGFCRLNFVNTHKSTEVVN